ncbi:MAG: hypothetical protein HYT06_00515 [Candidatus Levybacteria bacterium]|nr:hypothetical protein [Candidatus Levybacteria bacterium]
MFTLTNASKDVKAILKWAIISIILITLAFAIFRIGMVIKEMLYPTPLPAPTVLFGKLPGPTFPKNKVEDDFTYKIQTISGSLPEIYPQARIYTIALPKPDLLALDKAKSKAKAARFNNGPYKVSDIVYDFSTTKGDLVKTLRINIEDFNFEITSNYLEDSDLISGRNIPDEKNAIEKASDFLSLMGYSSTDLDYENPLVNFFDIDNGNFVKATSLSNTKLVQVNFFKQYIDDLNVYNEIPTESNVNVLLGTNAEIVGVTFVNQMVSDEYSTYPLKTIGEAFDELKNKKAYIASYFGTQKQVKINDASLAYYIEKNEKDFVYPIIVFTGSDGFYAYISAIRDEWIRN